MGQMWPAEEAEEGELRELVSEIDQWRWTGVRVMWRALEISWMMWVRDRLGLLMRT